MNRLHKFKLPKSNWVFPKKVLDKQSRLLEKEVAKILRKKTDEELEKYLEAK